MKLLLEWFMKLIAKVKFSDKDYIPQAHVLKIEAILKVTYCIILTKRRWHLSTLFIDLFQFIKLKGKARYSHAAINIEGENAPAKILEATSAGVKVNTLVGALDDVSAICLVIPKNLQRNEWDSVAERAYKQLNKKYDFFNNYDDDKTLNCVEYVRNSLHAGVADYDVKFRDFENMILKQKCLLPDTFFFCKDFNVFYEVRK